MLVGCLWTARCVVALLVFCVPQVRQGLYYNPYFPGGAIAMPRMLADGGVEYDDGTPSNSSQQAKVRQQAHNTPTSVHTQQN